jgi:hypothetical protein
MKCKTCGHEIAKTEELELFESKVLGLTLTKIQDWNKPYNEIVIPEGFRKIKIWELWQLLESEEMDKFLGDYKGKYNWFWCEQTNYAKKNGYSSGLCLDWNLDLYSVDGGLADSGDGGRVVFVKVKE